VAVQDALSRKESILREYGVQDTRTNKIAADGFTDNRDGQFPVAKPDGNEPSSSEHAVTSPAATGDVL
jgi:hypothetical protein